MGADGSLGSAWVRAYDAVPRPLNARPLSNALSWARFGDDVSVICCGAPAAVRFAAVATSSQPVAVASATGLDFFFAADAGVATAMLPTTSATSASTPTTERLERRSASMVRPLSHCSAAPMDEAHAL